MYAGTTKFTLYMFLDYVENKSQREEMCTSSAEGSKVMSNFSLSAPIESRLPCNNHVASSSGTKLCLANNMFRARHVSWLNSSILNINKKHNKHKFLTSATNAQTQLQLLCISLTIERDRERERE